MIQLDANAISDIDFTEYSDLQLLQFLTELDRNQLDRLSNLDISTKIKDVTLQRARGVWLMPGPIESKIARVSFILRVYAFATVGYEPNPRFLAPSNYFTSEQIMELVTDFLSDDSYAHTMERCLAILDYLELLQRFNLIES